MKLLYIFPALLLTAVGCKKDPVDDLPKATREGKNTAGCLINGQAFVATGWGSGMGRVAPLNGGFYTDSSFQIRLHGANRATLMLFVRVLRRPGTYGLAFDTPYWPASTCRFCLNHATYTLADGTMYGTSSQQTGQLTADYVNLAQYIGSGTFEFTAANVRDPSQTIRVTQGRFDVKN